MANNSIRIRTTPGSSKNVRIKLEQDFDFLEILSLKISQEDLYQTFCANYGVVVGRVIANKGFGLPNAKVSVFVPITEEDQKNQLIKDFYPFKTPYQKKDGIRYNLLVSKSTCNLNVPVGTFPTKEEVLDNDIILEVFDKYYKYTAKTNDAGDFMIFGVPIGQQTVHMDVDLSDTGSASLRPFDLIAEGFPAKLFKSNTEFKTSSNLDSLPQIKTANIGVDVIPFWGDPESCEVGITRVDFDTNADIKTSALFFGSVITDSGKMSLNKACNPKNKQGRVENLKTGPGTIEMIRVSEIDPVEWRNNNKIKPLDLEEFSVGDTELIDNNGTFAYAIPLNIGHIITDEFGNYVPSPDPSIGIATKGMYRFKMKMQGKTSIFAKTKAKFRTATMFFPSLGPDFGGTPGSVTADNRFLYPSTAGLSASTFVNLTGPNSLEAYSNGTEDQRWTADITQYNNGTNEPNSSILSPSFPGLQSYRNSRIGKDFHLFEWKQIYTIAHFIKKFKKGANRFSFLGIKQTDQSNFNPFPFTNAIWSFDLIYYLGAAIIDIRKFFIKLIIKIIGFCIKFCMRLVIDINVQIIPYIQLFPGYSKDVAKITISIDPISIGPYYLNFHVTLINFCYKICPLSFLGNIIDGFNLECENAPNGEGYQIPPVGGTTSFPNPPYDGTWYACNPVGCGTSFGCNCPNDPCTCPDPNDPTTCDYNIAYSNFFKFGIKASGTNNSSPCLNILTDWECCAKLSLAEERDVIQRVFNDAWVVGTAYFFAFKYKRKIKRSTGELRKEKFCGPGSDHQRGDNYWKNQCCLDAISPINDRCSKCLVRGPGYSRIINAFQDAYHVGASAYSQFVPAVTPTYGGHNNSVDIAKNGAVDIDDLIYCNALMSTKIVSLGSQELCQETLEQITNASLASQALVQYEQNSNFYTGTFYENGWDPNLWVDLMDETSYEDPIDVLQFMGKVFPQNPCQLRDMFYGGGINGCPCHEYELQDDPYFFMKEISKIYIDIETAGAAPNEDEFSPIGGPGSFASSVNNPYADLVNDPPQWGGFIVNKETASRFSPCGDYPSNCVGQPLNKWTNNINPSASWGYPLQGAIDPNDADNDGWDRYTGQTERNNPNSQSNIPYYYFGLNAGKTAINKLRTEFFSRGG